MPIFVTFVNNHTNAVFDTFLFPYKKSLVLCLTMFTFSLLFQIAAKINPGGAAEGGGGKRPLEDGSGNISFLPFLLFLLFLYYLHILKLVWVLVLSLMLLPYRTRS